MQPSTKALVTFVLVYLAGVIARSIVARAREKKPFSEGLKDKSNHASAAIVALIVAASTLFHI